MTTTATKIDPYRWTRVHEAAHLALIEEIRERGLEIGTLQIWPDERRVVIEGNDASVELDIIALSSSYDVAPDSLAVLPLLFERYAAHFERRAAPWRIEECYVDGVSDFDALRDAMGAGAHDIDLDDFQARAGLDEGWDWDDVEALIEHGKLTAEEIDDLIHAGLR